LPNAPNRVAERANLELPNVLPEPLVALRAVPVRSQRFKTTMSKVPIPRHSIPSWWEGTDYPIPFPSRWSGMGKWVVRPLLICASTHNEPDGSRTMGAQLGPGGKFGAEPLRCEARKPDRCQWA
jgi:hypothetical protein